MSANVNQNADNAKQTEKMALLPALRKLPVLWKK